MFETSVSPWLNRTHEGRANPALLPPSATRCYPSSSLGSPRQRRRSIHRWVLVMPVAFTESVVEEAALEWLAGIGYTVLNGPNIAVGMPFSERSDPNYRDVVLEGRLRQALARLNPALSSDAHRRCLPKTNTQRCPVAVGEQPHGASDAG